MEGAPSCTIVACAGGPCDVVCDDAQNCSQLALICSGGPCKASCPSSTAGRGSVEIDCAGASSCVNECE